MNMVVMNVCVYEICILEQTESFEQDDLMEICGSHLFQHFFRPELPSQTILKHHSWVPDDEDITLYFSGLSWFCFLIWETLSGIPFLKIDYWNLKQSLVAHVLPIVCLPRHCTQLLFSSKDNWALPQKVATRQLAVWLGSWSAEHSSGSLVLWRCKWFAITCYNCSERLSTSVIAFIFFVELLRNLLFTVAEGKCIIADSR